MFLQYLQSNFEGLDDISKPIEYGLDILEKTKEFSSLEDVSYLFTCLRRAQTDLAQVSKGPAKGNPTLSSTRRASRDALNAIESMTPNFKRYVSVYDDDDDFI